MSRDDGFDRPSNAELTGLDKFFNNSTTVIIVSVILFFCCSIGGAVFGLIGMLTCKNPESKKNATIMLIICGIGLAIGLILQFTGALAGLQQR